MANTLATTDNYQITARIDYNLSASQQIFGRVIKDHNILENSGPFPTSIASPIQNPKQSSVPGTWAVNYVNTLTPKIVLHLNAGFTRFNNDATHFSHGFDVTAWTCRLTSPARRTTLESFPRSIRAAIHR